VRLVELGKQTKSNNLTGNKTGDLPACSTVSELTTLPRAPFCEKETIVITKVHKIYRYMSVYGTGQQNNKEQ
jgi:hypothetical protein